MKKIALFLCIIALSLCGCALALEIPTEPPIQVSGIEVVEGKTLAWGANTDPDLGGYVVGYSLGGTEFIYCPMCHFDVGNVVKINIIDFPNAHYTNMAVVGQTVWLKLYAYDQAGGGQPNAYDVGDNLSAGSDAISINFSGL
jgi:hypothetical protein